MLIKDSYMQSVKQAGREEYELRRVP